VRAASGVLSSPNQEIFVNRGEIGRREFGRATAGRGPLATGRVREASPVLAAGVEEFIFADVFSRSGLPARERELLTIAVLAAIGGADNQLGVHVPAALECGADAEELIQLCEQITPYAGFPRALNALRAVRTVLEERGLPLPLPVADVQLRDHTTLVANVGEGDDGTLLVHSPELDRRMWRDLMRALPDGHHAVAADLRGAGAAVGASVPREIGELVADLVAVMDATGLRRAQVVTQGASAAIACAVADAHPDRVTHLTLIGPRTEAATAVPGPAALADQLRAQTLAVDTWAARYARDRLARLDHEGWTGLVAAVGGAELGRTGGIAVSVVAGAGDVVVDLALVGRAWPRAELTRVSEAGHLAPLEAPEACAQIVAAGS
jgi:3-oxoadipate enol-lactonase